MDKYEQDLSQFQECGRFLEGIASINVSVSPSEGRKGTAEAGGSSVVQISLSAWHQPATKLYLVLCAAPMPLLLLGTNACYVVSCDLRGSVLEPGEGIGSWRLASGRMNILIHLTPLLFSLAVRLYSNTSIQPDKRLSLLSCTGRHGPIKAGLTTCCAACPPCEVSLPPETKAGWDCDMCNCWPTVSCILQPTRP